MFLPRLCLLAVFASLLACAPESTTPPPEDQLAPEFVGGGQPGADGGLAYPGPFGVGTGSVIPNYEFLGFPRANVTHAALVRMQLADFYNPTGTETYPAGSPYGEGQPKPKALLIDRSAVWCPPCNYEAGHELPAKHLAYFPKGEFLVAIDDGPVAGTPAVQSDLNGWVTTYKIDYPAVLNPGQVFSAIVGVDAYPGHIIVRTRDMKIIKWIAGVPDDAFWQLFADVADEKI